MELMCYDFWGENILKLKALQVLLWKGDLIFLTEGQEQNNYNPTSKYCVARVPKPWAVDQYLSVAC